MYLDLCLCIWSFLGQAPVPQVATEATSTAATAAQTSGGGFNWTRYIFMVVYLMVCFGLTAVVMQQEQKSGGLQGMLGGGGEAPDHKYQGKKSFEENLKIIGNYLAVLFVILSVAMSYVMK
ncbi:preprotein translocase subunit SecG [bacterium]|nr:preprotein translocase subunit SecG [bacterium]